MSELRYYKDTEYGDWVIVSVGKNPKRRAPSVARPTD